MFDSISTVSRVVLVVSGLVAVTSLARLDPLAEPPVAPPLVEPTRLEPANVDGFSPMLEEPGRAGTFGRSDPQVWRCGLAE